MHRNRYLLIVDALGILIAVLAALNRVPVLWEPIHMYDEGLLLSISNLVLRGGVVFRDVYSNYPPGIYLLIAAIWTVTGASVMAAHVLALCLHIGIALLAGRLAGRMVTRPICWLTVGVVLGWIRALELIPFAWLAALFVLLLAVELILRAVRSNSRRDWILAGVAFAAVSYFRHDLFVYALPGFLGLFLVPASWARWLGIEAPLRSWPARWWLASAALTLAVLWVPLLIVAGIRPVARDLLIDAAKYVAPARAMAIPRLLTMVPTPLGIRLPIFMVGRFEGAVVLALAAPVIALALFFLLRWRRAIAGALAVLFMGLVSLAILPQLLGRTDPNHALYCMAPGAALSYAMFEVVGRLFRWKPVGLLIVCAASLVLAYPVYPRVWPIPATLVRPLDPQRSLGLARLGSIGEATPQLAASRRAVLQFVRENSGGRDAVYFGTETHAHVDVNESELYFLADRRPGTRYINFDPGVVDRGEIQAQMIQQLEHNQVRVVVISSRIPAPAVRAGSRLLDDYLAQHFVEVRRIGSYSLRLRR
jgi:hypothetical protein